MTDPRPNRGYTYRERLGRLPPGTTLLAYLSRHYTHTEASVWRERIVSGGVLLDGRRTDPDREVAEGMELTWHRPPWTEPPAPLRYGVLHRDEHVVAVEKPAGLPTLPGGGFLESTLVALVRRDFPGAAPVHRLGRWTSGVVLFARTPAARAGLAHAFRSGEAVKRYRALASGVPGSDGWTVEVPIGPVPHPLLRTVHAADPGGRPARSTVRVLEQRENVFLADVVIETGRPHQIRIHLAASGHPLAGDPLYPAGGVPPQDCTALPGDGGYLLHAAELRVELPGGGVLAVRSEPPALLRARGDS